jgi:hypothetical protein
VRQEAHARGAQRGTQLRMRGESIESRAQAAPILEATASAGKSART